MTDLDDPADRADHADGTGWSHAAWVQVDLAALVHNVAILRAATPTGAEVGILVKANAYGHGLEMAARAALAGGADRLVVATLDEALALRAAGIVARVLVVYPVPDDGIGDAVAADLELSVAGADSTRRTLGAWRAGRGSLAGRALRLHLEVDTGMGRGGVAVEDANLAADAIRDEEGASMVGVWSHLADGRDAVASGRQVARFERALASLGEGEGNGRTSPIRHLIATEALFAGTAPAYDLVRIGLGFYGELGLDVTPSPGLAALAASLRPALAIVARPARVEDVRVGATVGYGREWAAERPSRIATLPLGYGDGWTRSSWPGGSALVRGRRVPLVGRVSMDSVCADVTDAGDVSAADEIVLLGPQGDDRITVNELARLRGSIPNEVLCTLGPRLPRRYVGKLG